MKVFQEQCVYHLLAKIILILIRSMYSVVMVKYIFILLGSSFVLFCFTSCINVHDDEKFQAVGVLQWCFFSGFILLHVSGVQTFLALTSVESTTFPHVVVGTSTAI